MSPAASIVPPDIQELYEVHEWRHAAAVLTTEFPAEWSEIVDVLRHFRLYKSYIAVGGGNESKVSIAIGKGLKDHGWRERKFDTKVMIDDHGFDSPTHKVDCFKNRVALEVEWNNKDPFFDRDLNNFRLLFDLRAVSVGVIVTRCDELQGIFNELGRKTSYGMSTTHMSKLLPRLEGGGGGGCPVLVFGIRKALYDAEG